MKTRVQSSLKLH